MSIVPFAVSFSISPIILVGGVAQGVTGGMIPIVQLLQPDIFSDGLLSQPDTLALEDYFAVFSVIPGGSLLKNQIARWPLANLTVAANDQITQPLQISLRMTAPAQTRDGGINYNGKQSVMTNLQSTLAQHVAQGGWFNVVTPSYLYQGCLLTDLRDITGLPDGGQVQAEWQWDFEQPLITTAAAQAAQNQVMAKVSSQTQMTGDPPGSQPASVAVGAPGSNVVQNVVPSAAQPQGSNVAQPSPGSVPPPSSSVSPIPPGS